MKFMCGVEKFSYGGDESYFERVNQVNFSIPGKRTYVIITTGRDTLKPEINWYRIHCNSQSSPFIEIGQESIRPEQAELAVRHFEHLTGLTLSF